MAGFSFGHAASALGDALPSAYSKVLTDDEKRKRMLMDQEDQGLKSLLTILQMRNENQEFGKGQQDIFRSEEGRNKLSEYLTALQSGEQYKTDMDAYGQKKQGYDADASEGPDFTGPRRPEPGPAPTEPPEADLASVLPYMDTDAVKTGMEYIQKDRLKKDKANGGLFAGWKKKNDDRDLIMAGINPYGSNSGEKFTSDDEARAALDEWETRWNTSGKLGITEPYIEGAAKRAGATGEASAAGSIAGQTRGAGFNPVQTEGIDKLRKQFVTDANVKDMKTVYSNFEKTQRVYDRFKQGKATPYELSQSLGFFANKALDPNSVVMPGEFERFASGLSAVGSVEALARKLTTGGLKLTPKEYEGMFNIVKNSLDQTIEQSKPVYEQYKELAKDRGFNEDDVVGAYRNIFEKYGSGSNSNVTFNSVKEAESANLPKGTVIYINGRKAVVE